MIGSSQYSRLRAFDDYGSQTAAALHAHALGGHLLDLQHRAIFSSTTSLPTSKPAQTCSYPKFKGCILRWRDTKLVCNDIASFQSVKTSYKQ